MAKDSFGLPSVMLTLAQLYRCEGAEAFFVALESARRHALLNDAELGQLASKLNDEGRELIAFSRADADSGLESLIRLRLRGRGWDVRTQTQVPATGRVDLLIDGWLIIEADGQENHDDRSHRHKDLVRDANATIWGYRSLRFDYHMIIHDWDLVEQAIVAAYEAYHTAR